MLEAGRLLVGEAGGAEDELAAVDAEALAQAQVFVDVVSELAGLALDADRRVASMRKNVSSCWSSLGKMTDSWRAQEKSRWRFAEQASSLHEGVPLQPFASEEVRIAGADWMVPRPIFSCFW